MKYKVTLKGKTYEVEVDQGEAMILDEYEAYPPPRPLPLPWPPLPLLPPRLLLPLPLLPASR